MPALSGGTHDRIAPSAAMRLLLLLLPATALLALCPGSSAVRITHFSVPPFKVRGDDAHLACEFDLEGDALYSTKWYKEDDEFYRFVPRDRPRQLTFPVSGINVSLPHSGESHVTLRSVDVPSGGRFKCEVSAEAPSFQTAINVGAMAVVDLPDGPPVLSGGYPSYHVNEVVQLNCTSHHSKPAAELQWFVNGELAERRFLRPYPRVGEVDGTETAILGLEFKARRKHFETPTGEMRLRCSASIPDVYWKSRERTATRAERFHKAQLAEMRGGGGSGLCNSRALTGSRTLLLLVFLQCARRSH